LMRSMVAAGEAAALISERVWRELERTLSEAHPERGFEVLRDCGALGVLLPEFAASSDLAQALSALRHAAAGAHASAAGASGTPVRWAALLAGLPAAAVESVCARLRVPNEHRELAVLSARLAEHLAGSGQSRDAHASDAASLLALLELADAFRRPERFDLWLEVLAAREQATGVAPAACARQCARLRAARRAASAVQLDAAGLGNRRGAEIGAVLHARRLAALHALP
jgi:tRNA nucleotidyltransferase (CCA-adding enzyme)